MNTDGGRDSDMAELVRKGKNNDTQASGIEISDRQIEIFARRLLPEIKLFLANENIQREFEEWQRNQKDGKNK